MKQLLEETVVPFFKKYWWAWLALATGSIIILFVGPSTVGSYLYNVVTNILSLILLVGGAYAFFQYTFGKNEIGFWGVLRLIGFTATLISVIALVVYHREHRFLDLLAKSELTLARETYKSFFALGIIGITFIGLGELLLYLHKLNTTLKAKQAEMLCPQCIGKGYVDQNDIQRLQLGDDWTPGTCYFCAAQGHVPRGYTLKERPDSIDDINNHDKYESHHVDTTLHH